MHKLALLTTIAVIALSACDRAAPEITPVTGQVETMAAAQDEVAIELVATHAFETPAPIAQMAFTPNDVASWLGVIGMLSTDGHFYTSSVEGDRVRAISLDTHVDIIGLNHPGAPGMFLTLMDDGGLRAYIESDNTNGFTALPLKGTAPDIVKLCASARLSKVQSPAFMITASGKIKSYLAASDDDGFTLTESAVDTDSAATPTELCAASPDDTALLPQQSGNFSALLNQQRKDSSKSIFTDYGNETGLAAVINSDVHKQRAAHGIANETSLGTVFALYAPQQRTRLSNVTIGQGLSISGMSRARAIAATSAPFGGNAFNDGLIALADADDNRVVILSRSYLLNSIPSE